MALSNTNEVSTLYSGDGSTTTFATVFAFQQNSDVAVYTVTSGTQSLKVLGTDYTMTGGGPSGPNLNSTGSVIFGVAPAVGTSVLIIRSTAFTQSTVYTAATSFAGSTHENALDKLTMLVQELDWKISRAPSYNITSTYFPQIFPDGGSSSKGFLVGYDTSTGTNLQLYNPSALAVFGAVASGTGIIVQTNSSGAYQTATIVGTSNQITVTNGSGVAGSPTIAISATYVGQATITTLGTISTGVWNGTLVGATYGGTGVNNGSNTITLGGNVSTAGAFTVSGAFGTTLTVTGITSVTLPTSGTLVNSGVSTLSSLTSIGTIGTGTWQGTVVGATYGGTGVNNGSNTITLGGNVSTAGAFTTSGAFSLTLTTTGSTNVTLPTSGTLLTSASLTAGTNIGLSGTATINAISPTVLTKTSTYSIVAADNGKLIVATSGTFTFTLPSAAVAVNSGNFYCIISNEGTGVITVAPVSSQTFNGQATGNFTLNPGDQVEIYSDGSNWHCVDGPFSSPTFRNRSIYTSTGAGTFVTPVGVTRIFVQCVGGGGGGGSSTSTVAGSAGAGGGYCDAIIAAVPGTTYNLSVGTGGSGQAANGGTAATAGGNTSFTGSVTLTANGGAAGSSSGSAGAGGTATNGDINISGEGTSQSVTATLTVGNGGGNGGGPLGGQGGPGGTATAAGKPGQNYGGGGGAPNTNTSAAGGAGAQGIVVVWY